MMDRESKKYGYKYILLNIIDGEDIIDIGKNKNYLHFYKIEY